MITVWVTKTTRGVAYVTQTVITLVARRKTWLERRSSGDLVDLEKLRAAAEAAHRLVRAHDAAAAAASACRRITQADRASKLYAVYGDTMPVSAAEDDSLARQVDKALAAWRSMPPQPSAPSRTSQQLRDELSALPAPPEGDLEEHPSVRRALERTQRGQAQLELYERDRPLGQAPTATPADAPHGGVQRQPCWSRERSSWLSGYYSCCSRPVGGPGSQASFSG